MSPAHRQPPSTDRSRRLWLLAECVLALAAVAFTARYAWVSWARRDAWTATYPYANGVMTDFRDTVMIPWRALERGLNPYDIAQHRAAFPQAQEFDPYAPWWLTATHPFALLGWDSATLAYSIVSALVISGCAALAGWWVAGQLAGRPIPRLALALATAVAAWVWRPTSLGHGLGNVGSMAALFAALVVVAPNTVLASVFLALAWVKPQFGLPLVILLLARGRWRPAVYGTALAGLASLPMVVKLVGITGGLPQLVRSVLDAVSELGARTGGEPFAGRVDLAGVLSAAGVLSGGTLPMLVGAVLVALAGLAARRLGTQLPGLVALAASSAVLFGFPHLHYDLTMLVPALAWAAWEAWHQPQDSLHRWGTALVVLMQTASCIIPLGAFGVQLAQVQAPVMALSVVSLAALLVVQLRRPIPPHDLGTSHRPDPHRTDAPATHSESQ